MILRLLHVHKTHQLCWTNCHQPLQFLRENPASACWMSSSTVQTLSSSVGTDFLWEAEKLDPPGVETHIFWQPFIERDWSITTLKTNCQDFTLLGHQTDFSLHKLNLRLHRLSNVIMLKAPLSTQGHLVTMQERIAGPFSFFCHVTKYSFGLFLNLFSDQNVDIFCRTFIEKLILADDFESVYIFAVKTSTLWNFFLQKRSRSRYRSLHSLHLLIQTQNQVDFGINSVTSWETYLLFSIHSAFGTTQKPHMWNNVHLSRRFEKGCALFMHVYSCSWISFILKNYFW